MKIIYPENFRTVMKFFFLHSDKSLKEMKNSFSRSEVNTPEKIWNLFKPIVKYKKDPPGVETFQKFSTLFDSKKNIHKIPGAGDCDCFAGIVFAAAKYGRIQGNEIVLCSRNQFTPVHIYNKVGNFWIDLTQKDFNSKRYYPYFQLVTENF